jgi:glycosyltransferase involved in cell wall biosynthesis
MLKILHIIPTLKKGGAEHLVIDICRELSKRSGVEVRIVTFTNENEYLSITEGLNIETIHASVIPSISSKHAVNIGALMEYLLEFKPQIIHSHLFEAEIVSRWQLLDGVTYFTHCHDKIIQFKKAHLEVLYKRSAITNYYERHLLLKQYKKCNNHFIAISNDTRYYLEKNLPAAVNQIHLLQNAVDFPRYFNANERSIQGKAKITLITIGSFIKKKNQLFLVKVLEVLLKRSVPVHLILLGDGPGRIELETYVAEHNMMDHVQMLGCVDNVEEHLKRADIYVHASINEAFGLVFLEAMASGLPVVCYDGGGNRDLIQNGQNGYIHRELLAETFADTIESLLADPMKYKAMSGFAKEFARAFDIRQYVDKLLSLYHQKQGD